MDSPLAAALELVGDRWTLLVVDALLEGPKRFADLTEAVGGIAPNVLSQRLKRLEQDGLLVGRRYSERPVRFAYELTSAGRELAAAMHLLAEWGARRTGGTARAHDVCGTPLEPRLWCPTCAAVVRPEQPDEPTEL